VLTLYQAVWCPFSSAVREVLTELGVDFVARQVEPWPSERSELQALAGTDQIPVLQTEDGRIYRGTREIFAQLREVGPWQFAEAHRRRFADHRDARESDAPGQLVEYFRESEELGDVAAPGYRAASAGRSG
jgi:glutathione S-transferase